MSNSARFREAESITVRAESAVELQRVADISQLSIREIRVIRGAFASRFNTSTL